MVFIRVVRFACLRLRSLHSLTPTLVLMVVCAATLRAAPLTGEILIIVLKSLSQHYHLKTGSCITTSSVVVEYDEGSAPA